MTFRTYDGYLRAARIAIADQCPHPSSLMAGVADVVKAMPWRASTPTGRTLSGRAGQYVRNAWATEVLLNSPRQVGGDELITFANHWAVVQAYYAVFEGLNAVALTVAGKAPATHAGMLHWAGSQLGTSGSPFPSPWTSRVSGPPSAYSFDGFPPGWTRSLVSGIAGVTSLGCLDHLALALKTTRDRQIEDKKRQWLKGMKTKAGAPRKYVPTADVTKRASTMPATTLFDLLYRLRIRSNYQEADAFLRGALTPTDAAAFHRALCDVVGATLLIIEIHLAHQVGVPTLEKQLSAMKIPPIFAAASAEAREKHW
jgi:hypothetical protein